MPAAEGMRIPYVNLAAQFAEEREALMALAEDVLGKGMWVGGPEVEIFEKALRRYCEAGEAVAVGSGTDALILGLKALDIGAGDEVITPPNSFISSTAAIALVGARPVFADVLDDQNIDPEAVEAAITAKTRAIMPVHLTGRVAEMDAILDIAERHKVKVIEDAAQSIGSRYHGKRSGTFGDVGCFSAHPLKNLNAAGDAGFVLTGDGEIAERIRRLRNLGLANRDEVVEWAAVSRLDTLQCAILTERLQRLDGVIERRRKNAALYHRLVDRRHVFIPPDRDCEFNTFHTFVIQAERREALKQHLADRGIGTAIHYPIPIHRQPAAANLGYGKGDFPKAERQVERILSLPIHQFLSQADIEYVAETINGFYR